MLPLDSEQIKIEIETDWGSEMSLQVLTFFFFISPQFIKLINVSDPCQIART